MSNKQIIKNIQRQISIYEYGNFPNGSTVATDTLFTYNGILFRTHTTFVKTQSLADSLPNISVDSTTGLIIQKGSHGLNQFAPVYFTGTTVEAAISNTADKLATHIVIEKTDDWLLLVSNGTYNYPSHGLGTGQLYCSSTVAGTNSTIFSEYINPTIKIYDSSNFEVTTNIKSIYNAPVVETEGMTLVGFYQGDSATAQSWTINLDGDVTPRLKVVVHIDGYSTGGSTSSNLYVRATINGDTGANYGAAYRYVTTSNFSTATQSQSASTTTYLGGGITGYYACLILEGNLKVTGYPRLIYSRWNYRSGTNYYLLDYYYHWNNTASKVTTLNFSTAQYTKYRVYVYLGE
jgi:hypothetical protein